MEAVPSMNYAAMQSQRITNITSYDVLADPAVEGVVGEYQLDSYKKNVGNNRLKVFLALYQQDYERKLRQNDAMGCDSIVADVLHTLNTKCVPTGRFLINSVMSHSGGGSELEQMSNATRPPVWNLMGEYESKQLIHGILKGIPPPYAYRSSHPSQQMQQYNGDGATRLNDNGNSAADDHKRRRRSSLLRRSASDSLIDDSKKVSRFDQQQHRLDRRMSREEPTWSSSRNMTKIGATALNRMDVILTSNREALDPNSQSPGNNRLHILVAMQSGKYQQANDRQREAILDEVVQTVLRFWKGRFLTESTGGSYEVLENSDAKRALRHIFDMRAGQNLFSQASTPALNITPNTISSGLNSLGGMNNNDNGNDRNNFRGGNMEGMRISTSSLPVGNKSLISSDTKKMLSRHGSTSMIPTQMSSSLSRIEPPVDVSGIDDLRSAAIKSLQKQKARQKVANRLEKVSMRTSQQQMQLQFQQQFQQPMTNSMNNMNNSMNNMTVNNMHMNGGNGNSYSNFSMGGAAKKRQSSIFGTLDPTVMDEIVSGCFDDED